MTLQIWLFLGEGILDASKVIEGTGIKNRVGKASI